MTATAPENQTPELSELIGIYGDAAQSARLLLATYDVPIPPEMLADWSKRAALALARMADAFDGIEALVAREPADNAARPRQRG